MAVSSLTRNIRAHPQIIFDLLKDPAKHPLWIPKIGTSVQKGRGHPGVDTRYEHSVRVLGARIVGVWKITEYLADQVITATSEEGPLYFEARFALEPGPAGTKLTSRVAVRLDGPLRFIPAPLADRMLDEEMSAALRALAAEAKARQ